MALLFAVWNPHLELLLVGALPGCYIASLGFSVIAHELGHLAFAKWLQLEPYAVRIGHGPLLLKRKIRGVVWTFKAVPASGDIKVLPDDARWIVPRMFCMTAAGPVVNLMLFLATFWMMFSDASPLNSGDRSSSWGVFLMPMIYVNASSFLISVWPMGFSFEGLRLHNDGLIMLNLLLGRDPFVAFLKG